MNLNRHTQAHGHAELAKRAEAGEDMSLHCVDDTTGAVREMTQAEVDAMFDAAFADEARAERAMGYTA